MRCQFAAKTYPSRIFDRVHLGIRGGGGGVEPSNFHCVAVQQLAGQPGGRSGHKKRSIWPKTYSGLLQYDTQRKEVLPFFGEIPGERGSSCPSLDNPK